MSSKQFVISDAHAQDVAQVGAKAANLARLRAAGLPVPAFAVVTTDACEASRASELSTLVNNTVSHSDEHHTHDMADDPQTPQPAPRVLDQLRAHLVRLAKHGEILAVRSSSPEEDGVAGSFAGLLESCLHVPCEMSAVAEAVQRVWHSASAPRVAAYRNRRGLSGPAPVPAVIVQTMLEPDVSGVAFSADPVTGERAVCIVTAVSGVAAPLVDGAVDGQTWRVAQAGGMLAQPDAAASSPLLSDEQVRAVCDLTCRAAALFGHPQDVEWALVQGRLWLVQSRPITTLDAATATRGRQRVWDNANISESYGGVTTPMTFSFARSAYAGVYRAFCQLMGVPRYRIDANDDLFNQMLGLFRGRVYYNLHNWYRLIALLPGYASNRRFMEQMMGVREPMPDEIVGSLTTVSFSGKLRDRIAFVRSVIGVFTRYALLGRSTCRFERRVAEALALPAEQLATMRLGELTDYYRQLERSLLGRWDAPLVNDFFTMICFGLLRRMSERWLGDAGWARVSRLLGQTEGMISVEPARLIAAMGAQAAAIPNAAEVLCQADTPAVCHLLAQYPALHRAIDLYLDRFGDRCLEELKLETATLHEAPAMLWRAVGQAALRHRAAPATDDQALAEQRSTAAARRELRQSLRRRPMRRLMLHALMRAARRHLVLRENLRFERTRVFGRVRRILVQIGHRLTDTGALDQPADVFYLELDELLGVVEGHAACNDLRALSTARRAVFERYAAQPAPPERFETHGPVHLGDDLHDALMHAPTRATEDNDGSEPLLRGVGCYPGVVRGTVQRVHDPHEARPIDGRILVAERTDPGWVMLFPGAAGVLVQRGSVLSHSATLARELHIPTIVGLGGLMEQLQDGDEIEMNGASGTVRLLARHCDDAAAPTSRRRAG